VEARAGRGLAAVEGAQVPAGGDVSGHGLQTALTLGGRHGAEGSFGQVKLGFRVITWPQRPDLHVCGQPSFSMISSETE
jgi:hypothetical protein